MKPFVYDQAFGSLSFTKDGSFECPVCKGLTPDKRRLRKGEEIICRICGSKFKKEVSKAGTGGEIIVHGVRFVGYGPQFHICFRWVLK